MVKGNQTGNRNIPKKRKYGEKVYTKMPIQELILFGIYSIRQNGEVCTFERLVKECFERFPKVFGFTRYPQWPDSLRFDRPLRTLREKGLIVGGAKSQFSLTEFGEKIAIEVNRKLNSESILPEKEREVGRRSAEDRLIIYIKKSPLFKRFIKNPDGFCISEHEFRNLLRCTLETPIRVLKQNLNYFKNVAKSYREEEIMKFLITCEKNLLKRGKNG